MNQMMRNFKIQFAGLVVGLILSCALYGQELSQEEEMARKAADPLGEVKALMTDNTIAFKAGEDENDTTFGFQLQPAYSVPGSSKFNMIARAVIPIPSKVTAVSTVSVPKILSTSTTTPIASATPLKMVSNRFLFMSVSFLLSVPSIWILIASHHCAFGKTDTVLSYNVRTNGGLVNEVDIQ